MQFNRENIRRDMTFNPDMSLHQAFMDLAYDGWSQGGAEHWSYQDMLNNARFVYGEIVEMAIMLGNYNYQVENGGHSQYFENGYASEGGGCFNDHDPDCPLVSRLITLIDKHGIAKTELGKKVRGLLCEFQVRTSDNHNREDLEDFENPDYEPYGDLDDQYYEFHTQWMAELESYLKGWMEKNENPLS